jgi:hypothetical protein
LAVVYRTDSSARIDIEHIFPSLRSTRWKLRSPCDDTYNCHAWGGCDSTKRWEPTVDWYWPVAYPYSTVNYFQYYTVDSFIEGFATLGYRPCDNPKYQFGFQKIAVYTKPFMGMPNFPSHTARQRVFGIGWLSKLGNLEDIMHPALEDLKDGYGQPFMYMKRSWWTALTRRQTFHCAWTSLKFWLHRRVQPFCQLYCCPKKTGSSADPFKSNMFRIDPAMASKD